MSHLAMMRLCLWLLRSKSALTLGLQHTLRQLLLGNVLRLLELWLLLLLHCWLLLLNLLLFELVFDLLQPVSHSGDVVFLQIW